LGVSSTRHNFGLCILDFCFAVVKLPPSRSNFQKVRRDLFVPIKTCLRSAPLPILALARDARAILTIAFFSFIWGLRASFLRHEFRSPLVCFTAIDRPSLCSFSGVLVPFLRTYNSVFAAVFCAVPFWPLPPRCFRVSTQFCFLLAYPMTDFASLLASVCVLSSLSLRAGPFPCFFVLFFEPDNL